MYSSKNLARGNCFSSVRRNLLKALEYLVYDVLVYISVTISFIVYGISFHLFLG